MKIAFIADSICTSGLGHLNRCLALAESFKRINHVNSIFILTDKESIEWIGQRGFNYQMQLLGYWDYIILDTYLKKSNEISEIKLKTTCLVVFDDMGFPPKEADILINSGICANNLNYSRFSVDKVFLGPLFHPLRLEFSCILPQKKEKNQIKNILYELRLLFKDSLFHVIIGPYKIGNELLTGLIYPNTFFYESPSKISEIMMIADIAITGGGQTMYELAYLGIPAIVIEISSNQSANIIGFESIGAIKSAGSISDKNFIHNFRRCCIHILNHPNLLSEMSSKGMKLIDGKGADRIAKMINI
jgi:spore coat polysaccharide biosynthesis predicted glycosyltransferase SpsG